MKKKSVLWLFVWIENSNPLEKIKNNDSSNISKCIFPYIARQNSPKQNIPHSLYNLSGEIDKICRKTGNKRGVFLQCWIAKKSVLCLYTRLYHSLKRNMLHYIFPSFFSFALVLDTFFVSQNTAVTERWESLYKVGKITQHWFELKVSKEIKNPGSRLSSPTASFH